MKKNIFKFGLLLASLALIVMPTFAHAEWWAKNAAQSLVTNDGSGLANADIHVRNCYIGLGTATPCAIGGGGLSSVLASGKIFVGNASNVATGVNLTLSATPGAFSLANTGILTMPNADTSTRGLLSSTDWNTFNNKFSLPALTNGSVIFSNGTTLAQDNTKFFWDDTNNYLGLGMGTSPAAPLDVQGTNTTAVLGSEMITLAADRDFSSNTGNWTGTNWTIGGGVATHTAGANNFTLSNSALSAAPVSGQTYLITYTVNTTSAGGTSSYINVRIGGTDSNANIGITTGSVQNQVTLTAGSTGALTFIVNGATWEGTLDNISVKLVTEAKAVIAIRNSSNGKEVEIRAGSSGMDNIFYGLNSGQFTTTNAYGNSGFGPYTLQVLNNGQHNVAAGSYTLRRLTDGERNTAIGYASMAYTTVGDYNTAIGDFALASNIAGSQNTIIGAGSANSSQGNYSNNTIIGALTASNITGGASDNIIIGNAITLQNAGGSGQMSIGNLLFGAGLGSTGTTVSSGSLYVGATATSTTARFGIKGAGATSATNALFLENSSATNLMLVRNDGNVGISNTAPGELLSLGTAGTKLGVLSFAGNTSGKVIVQPAAAAGSWTLTLPTTDGNNLDVLTTDGSGVTSWAPASGSAYTFSTGLTNSASTITANLSTGIAGGQTAYGGTAASENLLLQSTTNATRGYVGITYAPTAIANYGLLSLGSEPFDGSSSGFFTGNADGTVIAGNLAGAFGGSFFDMQLAGVSKFRMSSTGNITVVNNINSTGVFTVKEIDAPTGQDLNIYSASSQLFKFHNDLGVYSFEYPGLTSYGSFNFASITGNRTYTWPDASGGVVLDSATQTLTNKRVTPRVAPMADATSFTPTADIADIMIQANTQGVGTLTANAPTGTPTDGQLLEIEIKSTNVQTFSWNGIYAGGTTTALPTASTGSSKVDKFYFQYSSFTSKWEIYNAQYGY